MIEIQLNENTAEDVKAIQELRAMGISDEQIQEWYNNSQKNTRQEKQTKFEVKDVVCDYGVFENGELKLILNSRRIALEIVELLEEDERIHKEFKPLDVEDLGV